VPPKTLAVTLPQMGESVTEGVVGSWRKQVGDQVAAGETLVEIQTDKIDAEVPAPESGQLVRILAAEGDVVAVGGPLAEIEVGAGVNGSAPAPAREVAAPPADPASPAAEPVPVPLPALGESVTEGVVGTWRKQVGDQVSAGETLVEIQTDKVDAEVPSPVDGRVLEVMVPEGETVAVGTVLARIEPGATVTAPVPPPVAQCLVYPVVRARLEPEAIEGPLAHGFFLTVEGMDAFRAAYVPDESVWEDAAVSPLLVGDLGDLPPAVVVTAGFDPLRYDGDAYAHRLADAGVEVEHRCYPDQVHGFFGMGIAPDSLALSTEVCDAAGRLVRRSAGAEEARGARRG